MKNYLLAAIILTTAAITAKAQSQPSSVASKSWYLFIDNLSVETYPALFNGLKENPDFSLNTTCKPARVTVIDVRSNAENAGFEDLERLLISFGFSGIREMENPGMESFEAECLKYRRN